MQVLGKYPVKSVSNKNLTASVTCHPYVELDVNFL